MNTRALRQYTLYAIFTYCVVMASYYIFQEFILFKPDTSTPRQYQAKVPEMKTVSFKTNDGLSLKSWYKAPEPGLPVIVYFHGNAGNIERRGPDVKAYLKAGYGVFLLSYRGYGNNPGRPTEKGLYTDARAAINWLKKKGFKSDCLVYFGESLGTGIATQMALEKPPAAMILQTPFTSITNLASYFYPYLPAKYLVKHEFNSYIKVPSITVPTLYILAGQDTVIPVAFGQRLYDVANQPKVLKLEALADHNTLEHVNEYTLRFLAQYRPITSCQ